MEPRNSVCHGATVFANALMHCGTTVDSFLRENLDWLAKATNWAKFSATAGGCSARVVAVVTCVCVCVFGGVKGESSVAARGRRAGAGPGRLAGGAEGWRGAPPSCAPPPQAWV